MATPLLCCDFVHSREKLNVGLVLTSKNMNIDPIPARGGWGLWGRQGEEKGGSCRPREELQTLDVCSRSPSNHVPRLSSRLQQVCRNVPRLCRGVSVPRPAAFQDLCTDASRSHPQRLLCRLQPRELGCWEEACAEETGLGLRVLERQDCSLAVTTCLHMAASPLL